MELKNNFLEDINNCRWLSRCGKKDDFSFDVKFFDEKDALESITSPRWEKIWKEARDDFSAYLRDNCKEVYESEWNKHTKKYRTEFVNPLCESLKKNYPDNEKYITFINFVRSNIIFLFMYNLFSDYYSNYFFEKMLEIYLAGHVPCGWEGSYSNGYFVVY